MRIPEYLKPFLFLAGFAAATATFAAKPDESGTRTWTSGSGKTIEATFLKMENGKVLLSRADGINVTIAITQLCPEDQQIAKQLAAGMSKLSSTGLKKSSGGILTDAEIKDLKTEWIDERTGRKVMFDASFGRRRLRRGERSKYRKSGKIPIRLSAALYEDWPERRRKRIKAMCRYYILDSEGKVVTKKSVPLDKLYVSTKGVGGYLAEMAKPGEYTAVIWVKKGMKKFGKRISVKLKPIK